MNGLGQSSVQPVETVIYGWGQYKDKIPNLPRAEQDKLDHLADLIVSSFAQSVLPPYRSVIIIGHSDKDWHGAAFEDTVSGNRAEAVEEALTNKVLELWDDRNMGPPPRGGAATANTRGTYGAHMARTAPPTGIRRASLPRTYRALPARALIPN